MKVLVTGATGFTGGALAQKLCQQGEDVRVIVRDTSKVKLPSTSSLEIIEGDIRDPDAVDRAVRGAEKVFHIAAVFRTAGISNQVYWDIHVRGTENLLKSSLSHRVKRFVHCSTVGVHGHVKNPPADENYSFNPSDIYQLTKLEGEKKALQFHRETGLPLAVIRPVAIYGPGDLRLLKLFKMASKKLTILLGSGQIYYHMVYIDDLVDGFILASEVDSATGETFIIGGNEILTLNELMDAISEVLGNSHLKVHLPVRPFQIAGTLCERICIPLRIEPPIYRRRVDFFTKSRAFDISKAKKIIGYQPKTSIYQGLKRTANWYSQEGLI